MITFVTDGPATSPESGLTGPADIPEPPADGPRTLGEKLARLRTALRGTLTGFPRVLSLVWAAGRLPAIGLLVATVAGGLSPAATAYVTRALINTVAAAARSHPAGAPAPVASIVVLVVVQALIFLTGSIAGAVNQICAELLHTKLALHIQHRIMDHASRLDLAFFEDSASYDLLNQANNEAATRPATMVGSAFGLIQTGITFLSMIGLLAALSPPLAALAILAPIPAFVADMRYGARGFRLSMWTSPIRRRMDYLSQLVTRDTYVKEVQVYGLAPYLVERFRRLGAAGYRRQRHLTVRRRAAAPAWNTISIAAGAVTYAYVGISAASGRLTLGDLTLYTTAAVALQAAIANLFQGVSAMYENNLYLDVLYRLLAMRPRVAVPARPASLPVPVRGHVVFEHVVFRYPGAPAPALDDVSFEIPPGGHVAVVGPNGAGKSTLVKLLCRLYEPERGRILLDGVDIAALDPRELRRQIGALFQDHVAYQATAAENIGLGDVGHLADRPAIRRAAELAGAGDLIGGLPAGYDTPLGKWFDRGVNLSGGQWQTIALARAFMRTTPLLVLDEPSSALDAQAEHDLFARLGLLAAGRTTLFISHRFSTVRRADRILVLDAGRIVATGTHEELMAGPGIYADLFLLQAAAYVGEARPSGAARSRWG